MPFMPECLPTRPEDVGATSPEAARAMYERSPHLRPCPRTTPPFQWLDKGWCEERCLNRVWQPRGGRK